jgi:hypothetical protein
MVKKKKCSQKKPLKLAEPENLMELVIRSIQHKYQLRGRMKKLWGGRCLRVSCTFTELAFWVSPKGQLRVAFGGEVANLKYHEPNDYSHFVFGKNFDDLKDPEWSPDYLVKKAGEVLKTFRVDIKKIAQKLGCQCKDCQGKVTIVNNRIVVED